MTQTTTAARGTGGPAPDQRGRHADAPAPGTGTPGPGGARPRGRLSGRIGSAFEGTPGKLRLAAIVGVLVCLVFAVLGGNAFRARGDALDQARASTEQLVRVQQIATDLTQADAIVTNAFLQGAKEAPGVVDQYQGFVADASRQLAEAAKAEPGDAAALAAVNDALTKYTAAVATARANNRLGYPVGGGYLRQASNLLRTPTAQQPAMLPTLQSVAKADADRVDDAFAAAGNAAWQLVIAGIAVLGGLLGVQIWLARRSRRIFNIPMTWGSLAVVVSLGLGAVALFATQATINSVHDTSYAATRALAQERIAAFDAKANESLTLVYQGTGQAYEQAFQKLFATASTQAQAAQLAGVADAGEAQLRSWNTIHKAIRGLDDNGNWQRAVDVATGTGPQTTSQPFNQLNTITKQALDDQASQVSDGLSSPGWLLVALGWLTLLLGLFAAATAWWGISQRLREYR